MNKLLLLFLFLASSASGQSVTFAWTPNPARWVGANNLVMGSTPAPTPASTPTATPTPLVPSNLRVLDDRFGFATHFQQGWPTSLMPLIAATGAGWIRDNSMPSDHYYTAAHKAGLKVCVIVVDVFTASLLAKNGWADAIEVTNEPNNAYASSHGANWESDLVTLTNSISTAVHAINPAIPVIGLGGQGTQIFNMLVMHPDIQGVVYHPYPPDNVSPSLVWEGLSEAYTTWIQALRGKTTLPFWETEWGFRGSLTGAYTYSLQASRLLARLQMARDLKIEHTFIYEFKDNGTEPYGVCDNAGKPKPSYYAVQNFILGEPTPTPTPQ